MKSKLLIVLLLFCVAGSQNLEFLHPLNIYKADIRYGEAESDSICIKWSRSIEVDTFWVYKGNQSLQYITDANMRTVWYNQPIRYERRMAPHHLKENIFDSPFRFNDLEGLAKNQNPGLAEKFITW